MNTLVVRCQLSFGSPKYQLVGQSYEHVEDYAGKHSALRRRRPQSARD